MTDTQLTTKERAESVDMAIRRLMLHCRPSDLSIDAVQHLANTIDRLTAERDDALLAVAATEIERDSLREALNRAPNEPNADLISRLQSACVGSCSCLVMTPEAKHHARDCTYRLHSECLDALRAAPPPSGVQYWVERLRGQEEITDTVLRHWLRGDDPDACGYGDQRERLGLTKGAEHE